MASIRLKDYLESLSTKGTISDNDLVPLLDSDSTNALKTTTKGTLTNLDSITGFNTFSSSVNSALDTLKFASSSNVSTSLEQSVDIAVLGAYTASQNTINTTNTNHRSAVNSYTGSQNTINTSVNSHILGISNYTSSNNSVIANIQSYTSSLKGAIEISGQDVNILGMLTAQQFNITRVSSSVQFQSGSTEFGDTSDDTHTFTGTILLNGSAIGLSELNSYTSSQNTINTSVNSHILKQATQTGSQDLVNLGISTYTGSQNVINNSVDSHIVGISTYTGSNELWKAGVRGEISGIEAWTASLDSTYATDAQLYQLYQATASVHSTTQSLNTQTGSQSNLNAQIGIATSSLNSVSASLIGITNGLMAFTASLDNSYAIDAQLYQLYQTTQSIQFATRSLNLQTGSQDLVNLGISTVTGSLIGITNGLMAFTAALDTTYATDAQLYPILQTTQSLELHSGSMVGITNGLMALTASFKAASIVSSSTQIHNYNLFAVTSSENVFFGKQSVSGALHVRDGITGSLKGNVDGIANNAVQVAVITTGATTDTTLYPIFSATQAPNTYIGPRVHESGSLYYNGVTRRLHMEGFVVSGSNNTAEISGSLNVSGSTNLTGSVTINESRVDNAWTSYVPTWTGTATDPVIGDGTITGAYKVIGKTCFVRGRILMGSTTTYGSGAWLVGLPFTASSPYGIQIPVSLLNNATAWYSGVMNGGRNGSSIFSEIQVQNVSGTADGITDTFPFTWGSGDEFVFNGSYEIA